MKTKLFATGVIAALVMATSVGCGNSTSGTTTGTGGTGGAGTAATTSSTTGSTSGSTSGTGGTTASSTSSTTGTTTGTTTTGTTTGTGTASGGTGGSGGSPGQGVFSCDAPATASSAGSCVTTDATTNQCNPVTNALCAATDECDAVVDNSGNPAGFQCFPGPNTATLCQACDDNNGPTCGGGLTCFGVSASASACARFCCSDADCGTGTCVTSQSGTPFFADTPSLGICGASQ